MLLDKQSLWFQSPNRVKPLSNSRCCTSASGTSNVSIAQSRQTSFQPPEEVKELEVVIAVSIAQSRQTSFQHAKLGGAHDMDFRFQSPNRVKPLSNHCLVRPFLVYRAMFQSPNRVKPLSNAGRAASGRASV